MIATTRAFSQEAQHLHRSVMRELIARTAKPDIISLAGGLPANEGLPTDSLRECFDFVLRRDGAETLQYRPQYAPLKEWIAAFMQTRGIDCDADQVFITNGNQQGLTILSRLFLDPEGTAVTEALTFTGIKQVTAGRGAQVNTIETDLNTGADVDALEKLFADDEQRPQLCVLIPDFHNPLGVSMSEDKRSKAAQLAAKYEVPLIEDDPYSPLRFTGHALRPIKAYDSGEMVFYLGSFSKMLAPSMRLGWMIAPRDLLPKITVFRESIDLESSALTQRAVAEFLRRGLLEPHLEQLNRIHHDRCMAMMHALDHHLGDLAHWTKPEGGLFVWLTLPETLDTWDMLETALKENVAYIPGSAFAIDDGYRNTIRLNFSKVEIPLIQEGIRRLAQVIRATL